MTYFDSQYVQRTIDAAWFWIKPLYIVQFAGFSIIIVSIFFSAYFIDAPPGSGQYNARWIINYVNLVSVFVMVVIFEVT